MNRRGFSLIEAAIVLGIVGLVIGGIWVAAAATNKQHKITQYTTGMLSLNEAIRRLYHGLDVSGYIRIDLDRAQLVKVTEAAPGWQVSPTLLNSGATYLVTPLGLPTGLRIDAGSIMWDVAFSTPQECMKIISMVTATSKQVQYVFLDGNFINSFPVVPTAAQCTPTGGSYIIAFSF